MIILIDQDGPLANLEARFLEVWRERYPHEYFVPLEKRKVFKLKEEYPPHLQSQVKGIWQEMGFYETILPTPGGIEAIQLMVTLGLEVIICTSPFGKYESCVLPKYTWIEKNLGRNFTDKIIFTQDKTFIKGDVLIDDNPEITGRYTPEWEHIVFDCPYNKNASKRRVSWSNWREVLNI